MALLQRARVPGGRAGRTGWRAGRVMRGRRKRSGRAPGRGRPDLELVGVLVYDQAKEGVDAGKLCDEAPTGVLATTDRDAVLQLVITEHLYGYFSAEAEGKLTKLRARLVSREALAVHAATMDLGKYLMMGRGGQPFNSTGF